MITDCEKADSCEHLHDTVEVTLNGGPYDGLVLNVMRATFIREMRGERMIGIPLEESATRSAYYRMLSGKRPIAVFDSYAIAQDCGG